MKKVITPVNCYALQSSRQAWKACARKLRKQAPGWKISFLGGSWKNIPKKKPDWCLMPEEVGEVARTASEFGFQVVVADSSPVQLEVGKKIISSSGQSGIVFVEARIDRKLPFKGNSFDACLLMGNVLSCAQAFSVLSVISQVLRSGGLLLGTVIDYDQVSGSKFFVRKPVNLACGLLSECIFVPDAFCFVCQIGF